MNKLLITAALVLTATVAHAKETDPSMVYTSAVLAFSGKYCSDTTQLPLMKEIVDGAIADSDQDLLDASNAKISREVKKMGLKLWCAKTRKAIPFS